MTSTEIPNPLAPLQSFVDNHQLAGAVTLVATANKILSLEAIGYADIAKPQPMAPDTVFWFASQTKPITATAFMMLVDEGRVGLDDSVEKYLPEFKDQWLKVEEDEAHLLLKKPHHPITIRNILSHTSGLPFASPMEQPSLDGLPLRDATRSYAMSPLEFEPDSQYQYSNEGINTAGRIIEVVSGMTYEEFMDARLLGPLGMTETTFWPSAAQLKRLAKAYKPSAAQTGLEETNLAQLRYPLDDGARYPMPAGGLFSTAEDALKFYQMMLNDGMADGKRYVSAAAVRAMTRKQTGPDVEASYGLGWSVGDGTFGHGGAYNTNTTIDARRGLITMWLTQHENFAEGVGEQINAAFQEVVDGWAKSA